MTIETLALISHCLAAASGLYILSKNKEIFTKVRDLETEAIYFSIFLSSIVSTLFLYKYDNFLSGTCPCFYFTTVGVMSVVFHFISGQYLKIKRKDL